MTKIPGRSYKTIEKDNYENLYSSNHEISSEALRQSLLLESELNYRGQISKHSLGRSVLEIGCGLGEHAFLIAEVASNITAIDISEVAIERAQASLASCPYRDRIKFMAMDIEDPGLSPGEYDLIADHEVFSSIDLEKSIPHFLNLLRPGGLLIGIECLGNNPLFNLNRRIKCILGKRTAWAISHILGKADLALLRENFEVISFKPFHLLAPFFGFLRFIPVKRLRQSLISLIHWIDATILKLEVMRPYAFKAVFVLRKKV